MIKINVIAGLAVAIAAATSAMAQTSAVPADNSKANQSPTHMQASADAQKNDPTDLSLTRRIRRSLMADKSLSTYAHNVKIVAVDGTVTLNGAVRSETEKKSIAAKAVSIAGEDHVVNQMTIAPPKS